MTRPTPVLRPPGPNWSLYADVGPGGRRVAVDGQRRVLGVLLRGLALRVEVGGGEPGQRLDRPMVLLGALGRRRLVVLGLLAEHGLAPAEVEGHHDGHAGAAGRRRCRARAGTSCGRAPPRPRSPACPTRCRGRCWSPTASTPGRTPASRSAAWSAGTRDRRTGPPSSGSGANSGRSGGSSNGGGGGAGVLRALNHSTSSSSSSKIGIPASVGRSSGATGVAGTPSAGVSRSSSGSGSGSGSGGGVSTSPPAGRTCGIRSEVSRAGISGTCGSTTSSSGRSLGRLATSAACMPVGSPTNSAR